MDLMNAVTSLLEDLQQAVGDGRNYEEQLQQKMDEIEEIKNNLDTYISEAEEVISAIENLSAGELDNALEDAANMVD